MRHIVRMKYQWTMGLFAVVVLASCTPYQQQGAALGGVAGGVLGNVAGGNSRSTVKGAAIGAGLGAGIAAMQENSARSNQQRGYQGGPNYQQDNYPPQNQSGSYPYAERTSTRGEVLSPYAPYNVIDVRGFRSGALAKDPSCGKIFRIP